MRGNLRERSQLPFFNLSSSMALLSFFPSTDSTTTLPLHHKPDSAKNKKKNKNKNKTRKNTPPPPPPPPPKPSSWENFKNLLSCKSTTLPPSSEVHDPSVAKTKYTMLSSTCGSSICAIREVVHGNTRVIHRLDSDHSHSSDSGSHNDCTTPLSSAARSVRSTVGVVAAAAPRSGTGRQLMKLSGCYECRAVDVHSLSRRYPRPRTLCPCPECGEVFSKSESLEQHHAIRHAVSELGPDDSGRHIVEIIFKSSWSCMTTTVAIDRILKIHNTNRTIARFEEYRNSVKSSSLRGPHHRSAADGNELLRFHSTFLTCSLGANNSTSLCLVTNNSSNNSSHPTTTSCSVCTIIRYGFGRAQHGLIRTTASSGRAHECCGGGGGGRRALLVCRVIAGRVGRKGDVTDMEEEEKGSYDSVTGDADGNLEELFVTNPRAILPCFVVIYRAVDH